MSSAPPARPKSYRKLMDKPAWLLLDANKRIVASIRADSADDARGLFRTHGLSGTWIRRAK